MAEPYVYVGVYKIAIVPNTKNILRRYGNIKFSSNKYFMLNFEKIVFGHQTKLNLK